MNVSHYKKDKHFSRGRSWRQAIPWLRGARIMKFLTPNPLSKDGEGASESPSPYLGKGSGDGDDCPLKHNDAREALRPHK